MALGKELRRYRPKLVLGFGEKTPLASPDHWQAMQITDAAVFYARLTKWDEYFDGLPVHTVSAQLYYTLALPRSSCRRRPGIWWSTSATRSKTKLASHPLLRHAVSAGQRAHLRAGAGRGARITARRPAFPAGELFASPRTLGTRDLMHFLFGQTPADQPQKPDVR